MMKLLILRIQRCAINTLLLSIQAQRAVLTSNSPDSSCILPVFQCPPCLVCTQTCLGKLATFLLSVLDGHTYDTGNRLFLWRGEHSPGREIRFARCSLIEVENNNKKHAEILRVKVQFDRWLSTLKLCNRLRAIRQ